MKIVIYRIYVNTTYKIFQASVRQKFDKKKKKLKFNRLTKEELQNWRKNSIKSKNVILKILIWNA